MGDRGTTNNGHNLPAAPVGLDAPREMRRVHRPAPAGAEPGEGLEPLPLFFMPST